METIEKVRHYVPSNEHELFLFKEALLLMFYDLWHSLAAPMLSLLDSFIPSCFQEMHQRSLELTIWNVPLGPAPWVNALELLRIMTMTLLGTVTAVTVECSEMPQCSAVLMSIPRKFNSVSPFACPCYMSDVFLCLALLFGCVFSLHMPYHRCAKSVFFSTGIERERERERARHLKHGSAQTNTMSKVLFGMFCRRQICSWMDDKMDPSNLTCQMWMQLPSTLLLGTH